MKAVLGFVFLLTGATVAYLVLTGKLPSTNPSGLLAPGTTSTTPSGSHVHSPGPTDPTVTNPTPPSGGIGGPHPTSGLLGDGPNPLGLPTMQAMNDLMSSQGGMQ